MWLGPRVWAWIWVWVSMGVRECLAACTMAEFPCRNKQCISLDRYCDGTPDCEDRSDEPSGCSPCNRTYYGRVGATYTLQIPRPRKGTLPHFCQLTFIASGDVYGDLVQLSIEKFNLGRFISHTASGCPDGYMQIEELSRPLNSGYWCGTSWGHNVFYSETSAITVMLRVFNLSDEDGRANPGAFSPQDTVMLSVSYRFLKKEKAILRYGAPYSPSYRGEDVPNTFCDKFFENCDKKNCKIQSPNFPGMYPRNLTCFYQIRQTRVPDGKMALIRVRQRNPHLIYIKDRNAPHLSRERKLQVGTGCHVLHDYLMAFDGNSTRTPVLATLCKGGAALTGITSSSSELLLLFHASPFDFPFQDSPRRRIFGFELDVEVEFVDRESTAYIREGKSCDYMVSSRGQRSGYIQSPLHSLLPNTTCTWRLLAGETEVVWLYFLHYRHVLHPEMPPPAQCSNTLTISDGDTLAPPTESTPTIIMDPYLNMTFNGTEENSTNTGVTVMGQFCRPEKLPRVCSGVHAPGPHAAPCLPGESYISESSALTLSLRYAAGTAPSHVEFLARYEFVDKRQWGVPTPGGGTCDRTFTMQPDRLFASPRDVFLFGRGGAHKLRCVYTFIAEPHQRIALRIIRSRMGSSCGTLYKHSSDRYECSHDGAADKPAIWITEEPWEGVYLPRACICNISHAQPFTIISYTNIIKIIFTIPVMTPSNDYNDFFLEGEYNMIETKEIKEKSSSKECQPGSRHLGGRHGNFTVGSGKGNYCLSLPRLVTAADGSFLFLRIRGFSASETNCQISGRINVYAVGGLAPIASICPGQNEDFTHVFSSGWKSSSEGPKDEHDPTNPWVNSSMNMGQSNYYFHQQQVDYQKRGRHYQRLRQQMSRDLVVEYVGNQTGRYMITWIGVWKPMQTAPLSPVGVDLCPHRCPEIEACLPADLWCDGAVHCPSGLDEGAAACGLLAALPWVYLAAGIVLFISLVALLAAVVVHRRRVQAQKEIEASIVSNNSHGGLKSTTQDFLIPPDKDGW
ncbi:uncharacterized protein LOC135204060 [Macrobrachium nipponense]|uniref:uncharacterized protein LOC135204060 n=1 Tax=Macrobrachium nipponense TaxID=159736 RepID=UPI0030C8C2A1